MASTPAPTPFCGLPPELLDHIMLCTQDPVFLWDVARHLSKHFQALVEASFRSDLLPSMRVLIPADGGFGALSSRTMTLEPTVSPECTQATDAADDVLWLSPLLACPQDAFEEWGRRDRLKRVLKTFGARELPCRVVLDMNERWRLRGDGLCLPWTELDADRGRLAVRWKVLLEMLFGELRQRKRELVRRAKELGIEAG